MAECAFIIYSPLSCCKDASATDHSFHAAWLYKKLGFVKRERHHTDRTVAELALAPLAKQRFIPAHLLVLLAVALLTPILQYLMS